MVGRYHKSGGFFLFFLVHLSMLGGGHIVVNVLYTVQAVHIRAIALSGNSNLKVFVSSSEYNESLDESGGGLEDQPSINSCLLFN